MKTRTFLIACPHCGAENKEEVPHGSDCEWSGGIGRVGGINWCWRCKKEFIWDNKHKKNRNSV